MIEIFKTNDQIKVHTLEEGDFRDWDLLLDLLYFDIKDVTKYHIFCVTAEHPKHIFKRVDNATAGPLI